MPEAYIALTPVHWFYLVGVLVILFTMILRKDTPLVCIAFLFGIGVVGKCSLAGGIQTIFSSIIYAISEFREVIATIALVTAFSKCLREIGKRCPSYEAGVKSYEDSCCFLVDLRWHHVCIFPVFVAISGSGTGRCYCTSNCCAVRINTACSSHGNEFVRPWFCPQL